MTEQAPEVKAPRSRGDHLKPWEVQELCRLLAAAEMPRSDMARKLGITSRAVGDFARRYKERIDEIRSHLDDEFAGLWAARKAARIAALQDEYERLLEHPKADHHEWSKARQAALRAVAEELGQLRQNVSVTGTVRHVLVGVNLDEVFPDDTADPVQPGMDPGELV